MKAKEILQIKSISHYYELCGLGKPRHPLIAVHKIEDIARPDIDAPIKFTLGYYVVTIKHNCSCKSQYGQTSFDYNEGVMGFFAPLQVLGTDKNDLQSNGWCLTFHPDFLLNSELAGKIKSYQFFYYHINEALILSASEEQDITELLDKITKELDRPIDNFSQDILIAQLDLLLHYCNRFYARQFITRKPLNHQLLSRFETLLEDSFLGKSTLEGLPTVTYFADQLNLSGKYLSDMLKQMTGLTTQQHIHEKLIQKAKERLSVTQLSVSEIAYELGFEHSQSFSKFFKIKTNQSPLEFRTSFN